MPLEWYIKYCRDAWKCGVFSLSITLDDCIMMEDEVLTSEILSNFDKSDSLKKENGEERNITLETKE